MDKAQSVSEFIEDAKKKNKLENTFFRGHSNYTWGLTPSVYRIDNETKDLMFIHNEHKMFNELISSVPHEFVQMNTFDALTKMQHYKLPTRVLDVTKNMLVALYFACNENTDTDGKVLILNIPEDKMCNSDSDKVSMLSNLSRCDQGVTWDERLLKYYIRTAKYISKEINKLFQKIEENYFDNNFWNIMTHLNSRRFYYDELNINKDILDRTGMFHKALEIIQKVKHEVKIPEITAAQKNALMAEIYKFYLDKVDEFISKQKEHISNTDLNKLISFIQQEKPYFQPKINPYDLEEVLLVNPKMNNQRIIRQNGAFLLFGVQSFNKTLAKFNETWITDSIIIDKEKKRKILDELDQLGINSSTLFPEIDYVSDYLKNKYKAKIHTVT